MSTDIEKESSQEAEEQLDGHAFEESTANVFQLAEEVIPASQNGERAETDEPPPADGSTQQTRISTIDRLREEHEAQKTPDEPAPRRNFQIPRKNREKKALFQPIISGSREFEDVLKILHSSYLEPNSVANFTYKKASLIHSELLEKEFTEKRRELKFEGRMDKELVEAYAYLLVERQQVQNICEKGLHVGHSKISILGNPSLGVYLSRYADLLQANPLDPGATGDVIIFKIMKGKMKSVFDQPGKSQMDSANKRSLDPTPKHECHVSKNVNRVNSLLAYRAFELTQYYLYEYGFDEIRRRPRHVCPYAVISFGYKDEMSQVPKAVPSSRSNSFNLERNMEHLNYTLWRGQLLNKGKHLCYAYMKSATRPFLPYKLNEKLDLETAMNIELLKKKVPPLIFCKETYNGLKEVVKGGMYCSLYEVVEKSRTGSNLESILQKLEKEKIVLVKPLGDKGFLFLLSPLQMVSPYDSQFGKSRALHAIFLFQEPRGVVNFAHKCTAIQENHEIMPDIMTFIPSLHFGIIQSRKDTTGDFNVVVEKHAREYLKRRATNCAKFREFVLYPYESRLDEKKYLYSTPRNRQNIHSSLQSYVFGPNAYAVEVQKAKEFITENHKPQQFSPVSDYEVLEEEAENSITDKNNGASNEIPTMLDSTPAVQRKPFQNADYDPVKVKDLIDLIQSRKQVDEEPETGSSTNNTGLKRKLESDSENVHKHLRSEYTEGGHYEGGNLTDSNSVLSLISGLGGQDSDLRQHELSTPTAPDSHGLIKLLLETLAGAGHLDASLAQSVNSALGLQSNTTDEDLRQIQDYGEIPGRDLLENEHPSQDDFVSFKEPPAPHNLGSEISCLSYPIDNDFRVRPTVVTENTVRLHEEQRADSICSFDDSSPCPSTPIEHPYHRQYSNPANCDLEIGWKLIPITGMKSSEDLVYLPPADALPNDPRIMTRLRSIDPDFPYSPVLDLQKISKSKLFNDTGEQFEHQSLFEGHHMFATRHSHGGIIESTVLDEYSNFSKRIQQLLKQNNILYISQTSTPLLSTQERVAKLSHHLHIQTSEIQVQHYVDALREKLNSIVSSLPYYHVQSQRHSPVTPLKDVSHIETMISIPLSESSGNRDASYGHGLPREVEATYGSCNEKQSLIVSDCYKTGLGINNKEAVLPLDQTLHMDKQQDLSQTNPNPATNLNISSTQPALSDFINQLKPEVFNSLVKIIKDVQKNTVKFYIHTEEENTVCREIKEYLTKLGNTECNPKQFLETKATLDKLLIIIQNEDIDSSIHKITGLVNLKKLSCVSFAGVDSLDDVKNHTYNELFVSGGFVVSDESVLDPESVPADKLKHFLKFLEELSSPEGKWQWKIHCKMQKKLKELARMNAKALSVLTLLNTYQKKHLVEILSYHSCDSQTRNAPELDCLIRLQVQNIHQRHVVFLTEKNVKMFYSYNDNGVIVTTVEEFMKNFETLVGHYNSATEENCLTQLAAGQETHSGNDQKDEEDMSLDSGDEMPHIEVCSKPPTNEALANESSHTHRSDLKLTSENEQLTSKANSGLKSEPPNHSEELKSVLTTFGNSAKQTAVPDQVSCSSVQESKFNVLTHQTFLGTSYPVTASQNNQDANH
ncbi:hypothetical protein NDU88_007596 [Pleurodeles waltl]|uniref:DUF3715 domain-containing protein n=1 Tax=Pleurodeles waltl TaxID=8319 RepID=A0AAV7N2H0_PLEWA|nr:hypothetical protein NDU88_007596 [Pleurodeles waltl]